MTQIVYGRSQSLVAKHEREQSSKNIVSQYGLIFREQQDRPANESAIRGMY